VSAADLSDEDLVRELERRALLPRCPCGKWSTFVGIWDGDGRTVRCHGCLKAIARCTC
jgi:hypothetical protein